MYKMGNQRFFQSCAKAKAAVIAIGFFAVFAHATLKDDVLSLSGNARVKAVWVRDSTGANNLYNESNNTRLMVFDTDAGMLRQIDGASQHLSPLITRDGNYVIWTNMSRKKSYVIGWDGSNKRELISSGQYIVLYCQWDNAAQRQWIYACDTEGFEEDARYVESAKVYRYPFSNGTVNLAQKQLFWDKAKFRAPFTVAGDAKYAAANMPWPDARVADIAAGTTVKINASGWACHVNIAPDASRRVYHLNNAHTSIAMFESPEADAQWINLSNTLPGNNGAYDIAAPRWSNHIRYLACGYPLRAQDPIGEFCIGKFNDAFNDVEWVALTNVNDRNYRDLIGDVWIEGGEGPGGSVARRRGSTHKKNSFNTDISAKYADGFLLLSYDGVLRELEIVAADGARILTWNGIASGVLNIACENLGSGLYYLRADIDGRKAAPIACITNLVRLRMH